MIIAVILILLIIIIGLRKRNVDQYLEVSDTTIINGIFVLFIFISHSTQYWPLSDSISDNLYQHVQNIHNQWVVTTFLAFSGYGVMMSIINKGDTYIKSYPIKRIIKTLVNFDIAILLYLLVAVLVGNHYSIYTIVGSFFGITSVGNSNWYIWAILIMYIASYVSALLTQNLNKQVIILLLISILYYCVMYYLGFEARFYSTIMCYSFGAFLAVHKEQIISSIKNNKVSMSTFMIIVIALSYKFRYNSVIMNISSVAFVCIIVIFLCYFRIKSKILFFMGKHAFSIYILQRIPGILIVNNILYFGNNRYFIIVADFICTLVMAVIFDKFLVLIDRYIYSLNIKLKDENR